MKFRKLEFNFDKFKIRTNINRKKDMYILAWKLFKIGVINFYFAKRLHFILRKKKRKDKKYIETRDKWNQPKEPIRCVKKVIARFAWNSSSNTLHNRRFFLSSRTYALDHAYRSFFLFFFNSIFLLNSSILTRLFNFKFLLLRFLFKLGKKNPVFKIEYSLTRENNF